MAKKKDDGHRMGKYCGYTVLPDGKIEIAKRYADEFRRLVQEESAIHKLLKSTIAECHRILTPIEKRQIDLWGTIRDDYGLDKTKVYRLHDFNIVEEIKEEGKKDG